MSKSSEGFILTSGVPNQYEDIASFVFLHSPSANLKMYENVIAARTHRRISCQTRLRVSSENIMLSVA